MDISIISAGFGGQGVLFAGQLLAYAGMDNGYNVSWIPSYGPEMRGGTANCTVIISTGTIGAPIVAQPDVAIVFNQPSFEKYEPLLKDGGLLISNSSLVEGVSQRTDIEEIRLPASAIAAQFGSDKMTNMVLIGALLTKRPVLTLESIEQTLIRRLPASKAHLLEGNKMALRQGAEAAGEIVV